MSSINTILLNEDTHHDFLSEQRVDPITRELLISGDEVIVCALCKTVYLKDVWIQTLQNTCCNQQETLEGLPENSFCYSDSMRPPQVDPPTIKSFEASKTTIFSSQEITLIWDVENADSIEINEGIGLVEMQGSITVRPQTDKTYRLIATNTIGKEEKHINIKTFPTPILQSLLIPTPDFSNHLHYNIQIGTPHIDVSFNMPDFNFNPPQFTNPNVDLNKIKPEYKPKISIFNLTKIYEHIKRRTAF